MHTRSRLPVFGLVLALAGCSQPSAPEPVQATPTRDEPSSPDAEAPPTPTPAPEPATVEREGMGKVWSEELAHLRRRYDVQIKRGEKVDNSYLPYEQAAQTQLQISRLTGDYADYAKTEKTIDKAFTIREGMGPYRLRARLDYTLHRLARVDDELEMARRAARVRGPKVVAAFLEFEGNLRMQQGRYDEAQKLWTVADSKEKNAAKMAWALWAFKTGDFDRADELYADLARNYHGLEGEGAAWLDLIQAIIDLDRGRYDEALAHLDDADADLLGYWLVDEHRAEITKLKGDLQRAEGMYRDIIVRTNNPEFMDALAGILAQTERGEESQQWVARAQARYEEQMALYPEAAYGHALGHFLEFGPKERALDLARKNHTIRPNAEAKKLLAQAELDSGNLETAKTVIEEALATPWNTAALHYTAHRVYTATGDTDKAAEELAKAKAINPHIAD